MVFTNPIFYCLGDSESTSADKTNATGAVIGGAVGGAAVFVVLAILLCVVIWCIRNSKKKKMKRNYSNFPLAVSNFNIELHSNPLYVTELPNMKTDGSSSKDHAKLCK